MTHPTPAPQPNRRVEHVVAFSVALRYAVDDLLDGRPLVGAQRGMLPANLGDIWEEEDKQQENER